MTIAATQLNNFATGAVYDLAEWGGVNVTVNQFVAMVAKVQDLDATLFDWLIDEITSVGYDTAPTYGLDTMARDLVMDIFAVVVAGQKWPMYAEGPEAMEQFVDTIAKTEYAVVEG